MKILVPKNCDSIISNQKILLPFDDLVIDFITDVSKNILTNSFYKHYPELISLAFWMRKSHLMKFKNDYYNQKQEKIWIGRGVVLHIAPSNVDTIFIYSLFLSLLVGNSNIVRVSSKENIQVNILINIINDIFNNNKYENIKNKIYVVSYDHNDEITKTLSLMADVRIIWGGDNTIKHIRTIPIKSTAVELTFADKFSIAIIKSNVIILNDSIDKLIVDFYNDSYWFSQMACSSIRLICWIGSERENNTARIKFWEKLNKYILSNKPLDIKPIDIINKLNAECLLGIDDNVKILKSENPYINRIKISEISKVKTDYHCGAGLFYEYETDDLNYIFTNINKKIQTVSQYGFKKEDIINQIIKSIPNGIDRIVPIGKSLEFSTVWDGYDLFRSLTREIEIL